MSTQLDDFKVQIQNRIKSVREIKEENQYLREKPRFKNGSLKCKKNDSIIWNKNKSVNTLK